ncbi:MAG: CRISPR-associated endonuclease Cas2 [Candidatus Pacebacteria bacterium]|nr:CRISPR-associated endonuclease Cas2 [Candidatus Paceibacterota bacterium]
MEKESKRRRRVGAFQFALIGAVAVGVVLVIGAAAPNAAQLLKYFPGYKKGARFNYQYKSALSKLAAKGFIVFVEEKGLKFARLTEEGKRALSLERARLGAMKKKRWDRRWRVVIFDIPERRKKSRVRLRTFMQECGFVRLQDSVWVYPYDCEDLMALAKTEFHIGADALYMIVEQIERDKHLREHFGLPQE